MAFVASHGNWTVVCAFSSAYVLTRKNAALSPFKCIDLAADEANEKANEKANDVEKKKTNPVVKDIQALCCRFSRDGSLFAVATNRKKCLIFDGNTWTQLFSLDLPKAPTAVDFAIAHEKRLVVADRAGNVIHFPLKADVEPRSDAEDDEGTAIKHGGAMILGHLSMVLDVKLTADERFLLTTDRDEKVRVSNYPQAFVIHSFCLGHTQFVRSIV
uniref:Uncharacterized protein n=1 Tax=Plectus sambesii TaxID=2011161 RepID=A0A914UZ45_9BILA